MVSSNVARLIRNSYAICRLAQVRELCTAKKAKNTMRELQIPDGVVGDDDATEMVRLWLAHGRPHVTLLLGMYEDAEDSDVDELWAWGNLLSDIAQHVANGLEESHGWDFTTSTRKLVQHFAAAMVVRAPGLEGGYPDSD
jgi:hypothetical protein